LIVALRRGTLHDDVRTFPDDPVREATATARTADPDRGRIEARAVSAAIARLQASHESMLRWN
jgi:hypothetical protein